MKFGENLRFLRKSKKLSQEDLADKIGVSRQSISKWECGDAYPEMNNILALCEIFNCKINSLVHEDFIDIDSLDNEIKMSVVKFKKEKQKKMKGLSKIIYILARIGKIASIIGIVGVIIAMVIMPIIIGNVKVINDTTIKVFGEEIKYESEEDELIIEYDNKENIINDSNEVMVINTVIEKLETNSSATIILFIEISFSLLIVSLILLYLTMNHLEKLFLNIHNGDTPFTLDNIKHIRKMALFMIIAVIIPNISGLITEIIFNNNLGIEFEMFDLIYILFLFSMAYIFEYGYEIQLDSNGRIYGDE